MSAHLRTATRGCFTRMQTFHGSLLSWGQCGSLAHFPPLPNSVPHSSHVEFFHFLSSHAVLPPGPSHTL